MISERSQIKAPGMDREPLQDVIDLEENDLEETDIREILSSTLHPSHLARTGAGCTAIEYVVYATSYQVPAFYFTVSDSGQSICSLVCRRNNSLSRRIAAKSRPSRTNQSFQRRCTVRSVCEGNPH
jgi:hypothetical protein